MQDACFGGIFSKISQTPKKLLSSMYLSRVGRKSETDNFFLGLTLQTIYHDSVRIAVCMYQ